MQSTLSGTCAEVTVCIVDVPDTEFSDTVETIPNEGWYFHKWNSGDRFFCGSSTFPNGVLNTDKIPINDAVEAIVSSETFYLMPVNNGC